MKKFNFSRILSLIVGGIILGVCLTTMAAVTLYRGVEVTPSTGMAKLANPNAFRFDATSGVSGVALSTYNSKSAAVAANRDYPCYLTFSVSAVSAVGATGPVSGLPPGYFAVYDDLDARVRGHWSISAPLANTSSVAASDVMVYAAAYRSAVVASGAQNNCR
jgi:hypothetical protein